MDGVVFQKVKEIVQVGVEIIDGNNSGKIALISSCSSQGESSDSSESIDSNSDLWHKRVPNKLILQTNPW